MQCWPHAACFVEAIKGEQSPRKMAHTGVIVLFSIIQVLHYLLCSLGSVSPENPGRCNTSPKAKAIFHITTLPHLKVIDSLMTSEA